MEPEATFLETGRRPRVDLVVRGAAEVLTCVPRGPDLLGSVPNGVVAVTGSEIVVVGSAAPVEARVDTSGAEVVEVAGGIVAPGFVDSHTHLVFGGSRVREYAARMTMSAEQVQALGIPTGIVATMEMTRAEDADALRASAAERLDEMLRHGTTTVESKSGYGLSTASEIKLLEVNRALSASHPVDVVSTFMGAHDFPPDVPRKRYVDLVIEEMIPEVSALGLADFCDVFCDEGYYSVDESRRILQAGWAAGLSPKIHTDQYSNLGGARMAAELGVVSADHLNYADEASLRLLAEAGSIGVLMPVIDFAVRHPRPIDASTWVAAGLPVAVATDMCPGGYTISQQLAVQFACRQNRLTPAQALYGATAGGAAALALSDRGSLAPGMRADLQVWDVPVPEDIVYRLGNNAVVRVIKNGKVVV